MRAALIVPLLVLLLLLVVPAAAQLSPAESAATRTVNVDWDRELDFTQYRTFAFEIPADRYQDVDNIDLRDRIMRSISAELVANGLEARAYSEEFDLLVAYGGDATTNSAHPDLRRLTVWITVSDARSGGMVWRGTAEQNLLDDEVANRAIGRGLITAMFESWPKRDAPPQ